MKAARRPRSAPSRSLPAAVPPQQAEPKPAATSEALAASPRQQAQRQVIQAMFGAARTPVAGPAPPSTVVPASRPALLVQRVGRAELQYVFTG